MYLRLRPAQALRVRIALQEGLGREAAPEGALGQEEPEPPREWRWGQALPKRALLARLEQSAPLLQEPERAGRAPDGERLERPPAAVRPVGAQPEQVPAKREDEGPEFEQQVAEPAGERALHGAAAARAARQAAA